jgi:hypothetical protein
MARCRPVGSGVQVLQTSRFSSRVGRTTSLLIGDISRAFSHTRFVGVIATALVSSMPCLGITPAHAQLGKERVPLILTNLPPQRTTLYRRLLKLAGRGNRQMLTLTKTEMWDVPKDKVEDIKRAAAQYGLGLNELGADWNHVFQKAIRHMGGELHAVIEMAEERMPQEHGPLPERIRINDPNSRDDPLITEGDASFGKPKGQNRQSKRQYVPTQGVVIDVIVAYTKKVASNYGDVKRDLVELAIEEGNESFRQSGVENVKLRLVHTYETSYVEEGATHFDHVWRFADKGDGYMDEIPGLRDKYRADVAVLIVDDPKGCGLATRVFADADEAFAVVHHGCAVTTYSLAHEIGHIIGARHELQIDKNFNPFPYGHGFVNGTKWRDIMSYRESCNGCPRVPIWSTPNIASYSWVSQRLWRMRPTSQKRLVRTRGGAIGRWSWRMRMAPRSDACWSM